MIVVIPMVLICNPLIPTLKCMDLMHYSMDPNAPTSENPNSHAIDRLGGEPLGHWPHGRRLSRAAPCGHNTIRASMGILYYIYK